MVDLSSQNLQRELRTRVARFLADDESSRRRALLSILARIREHKWDAVLFGGTLRDLMVYGLSRPPRDVDIVIADATTDDLAEVFGDLISKRTRFGGLHLQFRGWMFDIWPLSDTWAFKQLGRPDRDFATLPKTTFLNVEAVAVELATVRGKSRQVHAHGFFEAIGNRLLEINFEDNPFPALCVVRALLTAARLQFSIGRKLAEYLVHYGNVFSAEELVQIQLSHYGWCQRSASEFESWLNIIRNQYQAGLVGTEMARLPLTHSQQLRLFKDWTPAW